MTDYSTLKKNYDELIDLLATLTKASGTEASVEEITNTFKSEFIFYAGALSLIDGKIVEEEIKALSEIFGYNFNYDIVMKAAGGFANTMHDIPQCLSVAVQIDNAVADNAELNTLLSYHVIGLFTGIAQAVIFADNDSDYNEINLTVNYINQLKDYMNSNLCENALAKMPKE